MLIFLPHQQNDEPWSSRATTEISGCAFGDEAAFIGLRQAGGTIAGMVAVVGLSQGVQHVRAGQLRQHHIEHNRSGADRWPAAALFAIGRGGHLVPDAGQRTPFLAKKAAVIDQEIFMKVRSASEYIGRVEKYLEY